MSAKLRTQVPQGRVTDAALTTTQASRAKTVRAAAAKRPKPPNDVSATIATPDADWRQNCILLTNDLACLHFTLVNVGQVRQTDDRLPEVGGVGPKEGCCNLQTLSQNHRPLCAPQQALSPSAKQVLPCVIVYKWQCTAYLVIDDRVG
jgi:hypothetical protein